MKPFDKNNLAESLLIHEEMHRRFQIMHNMQNKLPMGYPPGFVHPDHWERLSNDMLLQTQDIGAVKFTDKPNDSKNSETIYYIHKGDNRSDKLGRTTDILEASDIGNSIIPKERLDEILLQYRMFERNSTHPDLERTLELYKSKDIYEYDSDIHLISSYNKRDIDLHHLGIYFQNFEAVVPELENFIKYTNEVYLISREIDNCPKTLSDIKTIINKFKIKISPAAYEFLKLEFSRGRIRICNITDDEYSIHIDTHHIYYSKLIALLNLPWKKNSINIDSKRKLIELIKSDRHDNLVIPADLIQSVVCILQNRI
jgi:hypothetical protein